ncbi:MAG: hypothetical protein KJS64_02690 [Acidobacteria bacterium]|nr:hypothetical protein [Acidobacteriota bacterium]
MEFTMSAQLTIGSLPNPEEIDRYVAPINGFTYAEQSDDGVNWHISEFFVEDGASWSCVLPDIAFVEGVLFAACYIHDDVDADDALSALAEVVNGETEFTEALGQFAITTAQRVAAKYHWTVTRWPHADFFASCHLVDFPADTLYFLHSYSDLHDE